MCQYLRALLISETTPHHAVPPDRWSSHGTVVPDRAEVILHGRTTFESHCLPKSSSILVRGIWYFSFMYFQVKASCHYSRNVPAPKSSVAWGGWCWVCPRPTALWPYLRLNWCQSKRCSWNSRGHIYDFDSRQDEVYIFV